MVPEPGDRAGFQSVHHCLPIVHKRLVQSERRQGEQKGRVCELDNDRTNAGP